MEAVAKFDHSKVRCPICTEVGQWKSVDQYRYKPSGMSLCTSCGFVSYPETLSKTARLKDFYREEYRDAPSVNNLYTGERKLHYHGEFLHTLFEQWEKDGIKEPAVCEIGAAFGMWLDWMKKAIPGAKLFGTELTTSMVRNAFHLYGLRLTDDIDESVQYDLIASYKVAEHQPNIDHELKKYAKLLKPGGRLYISVPTWFGRMSNFGVEGFSLEYYYHKNHINAWTQKLFEGLLARCGFEVVQENHTFYDDTYLCVVNEEKKSLPMVKEDPAAIEKSLAAIHEAAKAFDCGEYERAVAAWPNFPEAHALNYEMNRQKLHSQGFEWILENIGARALTACPKSVRALLLNADICMRYNQWEKALEFLNQTLDWKPNDGTTLMNVAHCFRQIAQLTPGPERIRMVKEARNVMKVVSSVSQQTKPEALSWMMQDNARIPTPWEQAAQPKG
jgi:2-polyprenyl-3-methyl-5-hydroxy-6-metoxy-1,4-benzoquinol methylase